MSGLWGTEISFRLGPGTADEARAIAGRLAAAAAGALRHVLFVDAGRGEYGCLAEWDRPDAADAYAALPAVGRELEALEARTGRPARVRRYGMEEVPPGV